MEAASFKYNWKKMETAGQDIDGEEWSVAYALQGVT